MALSDLNWRMLTPVVLQNATINGLLDVIYAMGTSTTYSDGSARVPGTNSAWTWTRDTTNAVQNGANTACIGVPPINALNMGYIIAGSTNAAAPTMNTDGYSPSFPLIGMSKGGGAYTNWTSALPFGSGYFSGYVLGARTGYTTAGTTVYMWESEEGVVLQFALSGVATLLGAGALIDPLSSAAANAETDGRLYSVFTTGGTSNLGVTWLSSIANTTSSPLYGAAVASNSHWYTFNVGNVNTTRLCNRLYAGASVSTQLLTSGAPTLNPMQMYFPTGGGFAGQLRNMYFAKSSPLGVAWQYGGTVYGYTLSYSNIAAGDVLLLQY